MALARIDRQQSGGLTIVAFPAAALGVIIPAAPATARSVLEAWPDAAVAIDGPMFGYCAGEPQDYASYRCGRVDYLLQDARSGTWNPGNASFATRGLTLSVKDGVAYASDDRSPLPGATVAVQGYPGLVLAGRIVVGQAAAGTPDAQPNLRVAVGVLADGRVAFARANASLYGFAQMLQAAGFVAAAYTDGGGSASLVLRRSDGSLEGTDSDDPGGRRVPSWIVAWSTVPDGSGPATGSAGTPAGTGSLTGGAGTGLSTLLSADAWRRAAPVVAVGGVSVLAAAALFLVLTQEPARS